MSKLEGQRRVSTVGVVDEHVVHTHLGDVSHRQLATDGVAHHAARTIGPDENGLAVGQADEVLAGLRTLVVIERPIVEDRAVLVHLDEGGTAVLGGRSEHLGEVLAVGIDGSSHEGASGTQGHGQRAERGVN